uniref:NADH-ubiquinone oxidoreductase chain 3 n=1 Tax=Strongyloides venezuelensis TaxID=75913 RepID=A0A0P0YKK5_STRVS|nr:NADH dehydrogenase subunit 3 [Strongyloides venezuelensis]BAT21223.1 NADH dehydrogenase subunit 3 [Strongyloides venezuelensis]
MFVLHVVLFFSLFFIFLFYLISFLLSYYVFSKNKVSSFECGFSTVGKIQNSFSIHFFLIMLIFVVFDLEVVMFLGVLVSDIHSLFTFLLLMLFIMFGFYLEWWYGKLYWMV